MSEERKCSACGKKKAVSEMKTCMHNQMHRYVCDTKCMNDFYNPPKRVIAQPAEAEGADVRKIVVDSLVGMIAGVTRMIPPADQPLPDFIQAPVDRAVERINAALSAVTAERDRLRKDAERWRYVSLQGDDTHWLNLLRVDLEDFGGNINAAVDALIDGEAPAMAAKEAGPEHVCSGCGAKGWTGNCLECIPY